MEAFGQSVCGEGTHSVTKDGILTCVLNNPSSEMYGFDPNSLQDSLTTSLISEYLNTNLGNVFAVSPIIHDILHYVTSMAGIIPITAGALVGIVFLVKRMKEKDEFKELEKEQKEKKVKKQFKLNIKFPKFNMKLNLKKKKSEDVVAENIDLVLKDTEIDYDKIRENAKEFEDSTEEKYNSPEEALIASLEPARTELKEPETMSIEELEAKITSDGHKVELSDGKIDITQKPQIVVKPTTEEVLKTVVDVESDKMEKKLGEALEEDKEFDPTEEQIESIQEYFEPQKEIEQPPPTEEEINEVTKLIKGGMSQEDAINQVVNKKIDRLEAESKLKPMNIVEILEPETRTKEQIDESQDIDEMNDERDIFKLDIPKKKKSALQLKFEQSGIGKKFKEKSDEKEQKKKKFADTKDVLTPLGNKRMLEYANKINIKLENWAQDQLHHTYEQKLKSSGEPNLSPDEIKLALKKFALFASMCEMMADKKTSKKRYWTRTNRHATP